MEIDNWVLTHLWTIEGGRWETCSTVNCIFTKSGNRIDTTHLWVLKVRLTNLTNDSTSANTPVNDWGGRWVGNIFNSQSYFYEKWKPSDTTCWKTGKFDKRQPKETIKSGGYKNRFQITQHSNCCNYGSILTDREEDNINFNQISFKTLSFTKLVQSQRCLAIIEVC